MSQDTQSDAENGGIELRSRRRRLLGWLGSLGVVAFVVGLVTPLKDLAVVAEKVGTGNDAASNLPGQRLVFAHVHQQEPGGHTHEEGAFVKVDNLTAPDDALVYPENLTDSDNYLINLHRLEPDKIADPTKLDWTDQGYVAYSAICTHLGCTVGWHVKPDDVGHAYDYCPCHAGEYDPYHGAEVIGGPPPRPVPQIGVKVNDNGELEITSQFEGPIGSE